MAGYTNSNLNDIYTYLGFNFYVDFEPQIAQSIHSTQAESDGGDQPDGTLQAKVLTIINTLQTVIDAQLLQLTYIDFVTQSSKGSTVDPARGDFLMRKQGRRLIQQLCTILAIKGVRKDYYGAPEVVNSNNGLSYFPEDF